MQEIPRKITNPTEYLHLLDNLERFWEEENKNKGHFLKISKEGLSKLANPSLLTFEYHVWSTEKLDSIAMFQSAFSPLFNETVFQEIIWLAKNGCGVKLLNAARNFARQKGIKHWILGASVRMADDRLKKFYQKIGCVEDSMSYIGLV